MWANDSQTKSSFDSARRCSGAGRCKWFLLAVATLMAWACGGGTTAPDVGQLHVGVSGLTTDVSGVLYKVECEDGTELSQYVPLEEHGLPHHVDSDLAGSAFADWFTLLAPGICTVTAIAMEDPDTPASGCSEATEEVEIVAHQTTEIVLVIVCEGKPIGALDVVAVIVEGPGIVDIVFEPSKFIPQCEEVVITVTAEGGEGALEYEFEFITTPPAADYTWSHVGGQLTFYAETPGMYEVVVTVSDAHGFSTGMTFPIHVIDDPMIEHCDEVCCRLQDDTIIYVASLEACLELGGEEVDIELCKREVCCDTDEGPAYVPLAFCPASAVLPWDECEEVCCAYQDESVAFMPNSAACLDSGGWVVDHELCLDEVCCHTDDGPAIVPAGDCPAEDVLDMERCRFCCEIDGVYYFMPSPDHCVEAGGEVVDYVKCTEICCELNGLYYEMTEQKCLDNGGLVVDHEECQPTVCCEVPDGTFELMPEATCDALGGTPVADELCKEVCCVKDGVTEVMTLGLCEVIDGVAVEWEKCLEVHTWTAAYTLDPDVSCEETPYLVVPSTAANQLAVYDLTTLEPIAGTPFNTCANPSRILMDANTDVYAACRVDGRVNKHTRGGALLWSTPLPGCHASRGIALSGDNRLFAGCDWGDNSGFVFELDPATGTVVGSVDTGLSIYGLAVDAEGIYSAGVSGMSVVKIHLGGALDMQVAWTVAFDSRLYGIAADNMGKVWIGFAGNPMLYGLSTLDGSVLDSVPTEVEVDGVTEYPGTYGLTVGLDGAVYGATMRGYYVKYDPVDDEVSAYKLDPAASGNRGQALDVDHNVYSVNLTSSTLTKTTPGGVSTGFGDDAGTAFLQGPYAYSGDMTGITSSCMASTTDEWYSAPLDTGSPGTTWLTIEWDATTPPGSSVSVYYSTDGGASWTMAVNGGALGVVGQTLQLKAILSSTIVGNEPTLHDVTVTYH